MGGNTKAIFTDYQILANIFVFKLKSNENTSTSSYWYSLNGHEVWSNWSAYQFEYDPCNDTQTFFASHMFCGSFVFCIQLSGERGVAILCKKYLSDEFKLTMNYF